MKITFITSQSFIDHSYTIIKELRTHVDLNVFIFGKKNTEEIKEFCGKFSAVFVKTGRYRNPLIYLSGLMFILKLRSLKAEKYWFNAIPLHLSLWVKLFLKNPLVWIHDVDIHPQDKDLHYTFSRKVMFLFFKKNICVASKTQAEIFSRNYPGYTPKIFQLPVIDYYEDCSAQKTVIDKTSDTTNFLFFGAVKPYKGLEVLLDAAEQLVSQNLKITVNIYGKIYYNHEYFRNKISELKDIVNFTDVYLDYKLVNSQFLLNDMVILPYTQVTQCGPLLIAYNLSIPVLCSDRPGFREYVDENLSGLFFGNTSESLAEKMRFACENSQLLEKMKSYISNEMREKFGMKFLVNQYMENFRGKKS